jgi:hypothetical protein
MLLARMSLKSMHSFRLCRHLTASGIEDCRGENDSANVNKIIEIAKDVSTQLL